MASKEEIYVSLNKEDYKLNKYKLISNQEDLLIILKNINNLKVLSRQKNDLKKRLSELISSTLSNLNLLREKTPLPNLPKEIQEKIGKTKMGEDSSIDKNIDEELKQIRKKLKNLQSL
tara:strand:+ start:2018 stop:2371 length:354 start_codon:yes stop_codon:yes gene_type:complete